MADTATTDIDPLFLPKVNALLEAAGASGLAAQPIWSIKVLGTWRDSEDQATAKACGLSNAGAGQSPHNCCDAKGHPSARAIDFGIFDETGKYITDGTDPRYALVGALAEGLGMVWGGGWLHPDYDHVEMTNWRMAIS